MSPTLASTSPSTHRETTARQAGADDVPCSVAPVPEDPPIPLALGRRRVFDIRYRAIVMGILNRTPDSFFDRGSYFDFDSFVRKAERHVLDGADFVDIGGVKAGPGPEVTPQEELDRVIPAIEAVRARFDIPISVDTFRASVAREAYRAGADIGNDISGFADPGYLPAASEAGASVVATHIRLGPRIPDPTPHYDNLIGDVRGFLELRSARAVAAGIAPERVMVDAGLDLGKSEPMSVVLLRNSDDLLRLGFPVFLSASNKRFLGVLTGAGLDDRTDATGAAHALGIALGCRVLRAHDVRGGRRVADVMAAVLDARAADRNDDGTWSPTVRSALPTVLATVGSRER
jgi:dihydropteroate synthase